MAKWNELLNKRGASADGAGRPGAQSSFVVSRSIGDDADEGQRADVVIKGPASLARLLLELDEQWPILRFLGFGFYYAWIWLCYSSGMLVPSTGAAPGWENTTFVMYLLSTTALSVSLILAAVFEKLSTRVIASNRAVLALGILAAAATWMVRSFAPAGATNPLFMAGCVLTGVGTSGVALRLGSVYSKVGSRRALMYTACSFVLAAALYFAVVGMPGEVGPVLMALLPVVAVTFTMTVADTVDAPAIRPDDARDSYELPRGFTLRLVVGIAVFSAIAGVTQGYSALKSPETSLGANGSAIVLGMGLVALVVYTLAAARGENFDYARLYYPIILLLVAGLLIAPLLGSGSSPFGAVFVGVAYACFIMMVWCLLAQTAYSTGISATRVYGVGRGASAAGTTIGWAVGLALVNSGDFNAMVSMSIASVFVLLMMALFVLNDATIGSVLRTEHVLDITRMPAEGPQASAEPLASDSEGLDKIAPPADEEAWDTPEDDADEETGERRKGAWARKCDAVCDAYRLSERERDVLYLLAKGRSIGYIAEYLHVSFNTSKSHVRHVYVKTGVHTRQELLDLVEKIEV